MHGSRRYDHGADGGEGLSALRGAARGAAVAVAGAALVTAGAASAEPREPAPKKPEPAPFAVQGDRLVVTAPAYQVALSRETGAIVEIVDRASGSRVVVGSAGCLWRAIAYEDASTFGGCEFRDAATGRFSYRWQAAARTLTLEYANDADAAVTATATLTAGDTSFDLRLAVENGSRRTLDTVQFPTDLLGSVEDAEAGYSPTYLPGLRFNRSFFSRITHNVFTYPSRWAFADYVALDVADGRLALYSVNPPPAAIAPVRVGFVHDDTGPCAGRVFCIRHSFETWVEGGETWESPTVRVTLGADAQTTILGYRRDNEIEAYPSLAQKLGKQLGPLSRAPLVKADLWKGLMPFREWAPELRRIPAPALLHPVAFQPRGHDENDPDFLPPDPRWGTAADFRAAVEDAQKQGLLVMPYLNVSWWDLESPTLSTLPPPLTLSSVAVQGDDRRPVRETYAGKTGYLVSPHVPFVRKRVEGLMKEWREEVPADCVFFDQIGARPWLRDFNPAAPSPLSYGDGWIDVLAPFTGRCLMVEDGWDRLAQVAAGFHGSVLIMHRQFDEPDSRFGATWEPYPLALWLLHDKVLMYQHDLYEGTFATDAEIVTFNTAFGFVHSQIWEGWTDSLASEWLELSSVLQQLLGPLYAGARLHDYRTVAPGVTASHFGRRLTVIANWNRGRTYDAGAATLAPLGFLAESRDGSVVAGAFSDEFGGAELTPGTHFLLVERTKDATIVRQPVGRDTPVAVDPPALPAGTRLVARAIGYDGKLIKEIPGELREGRFVFPFTRVIGDAWVLAYRVEAAADP